MNYPIAITTYNRLSTLKKTLKSLEECYESDRSIYFFCDGYKDAEDMSERIAVDETLSYLFWGEHINARYFLSQINRGLKGNTFYAIDEMSKISDKFILIQDDMEFSKDFLQFMDWALDKYEDDNKIMFISGHSHINARKCYTNNFISEGLGIWKNKLIFNNLEYVVEPKEYQLKDFSDYTSPFFANILRNVQSGGTQSPMMILNYIMYLREAACLHPSGNKLRHLVTDSQNCKAKDAKKLNRVLTEGWTEELLTGLNEPVRELHRYKWYKKLSRAVMRTIQKLSFTN